MKWTGRLLFCLFLFLSLGCFCFPQEQPAVILSGEEVSQINQELRNMKLQVQALRESRKNSLSELNQLRKTCDKLETELNQALAALAKSETELINLSNNKKEWETSLENMKEEYFRLSQFCQTLEKKNKVLKRFAVGVVAVSVGAVVYAFVR